MRGPYWNAPFGMELLSEPPALIPSRQMCFPLARPNSVWEMKTRCGRSEVMPERMEPGHPLWQDICAPLSRVNSWGNR
jgi:hypothetical protein